MSGYEYVLERLIQFRKSLNLTQAKMAEKLNISQEQYSYLETGKVKITAELLKKLAELGLDINYFITGELCDNSGENKLSLMFQSLEGSEHKTELKRMICYMICLLGGKAGGDKSTNQRLLDYMNMHRDDFSMVLFVREDLNYQQIPLANELGLGIKKYRKMEKGSIYPDAELLYELYKKSGYLPILFLDICDREEYVMDLFWNEIPKERQAQLRDIFVNIDKMLGNL